MEKERKFNEWFLTNQQRIGQSSFAQAMRVLYGYDRMYKTKDIMRLTKESRKNYEDIESCFKYLCRFQGNESVVYEWQRIIISLCEAAAGALIKEKIFEKEDDCYNHLYLPFMIQKVDQERMDKIFTAITIEVEASLVLEEKRFTAFTE